MVEVLPVETPTLGDRSYLAHDGGSALVIDPQRDIDRVSSLAAQLVDKHTLQSPDWPNVFALYWNLMLKGLA